MNTQEIIEMFELYLDDTSELSSVEELALANRVYKKIMLKTYEFAKKDGTGTLSTTLPYVSLPTDFAFIPDTVSDEFPKVIYVGSNNDIYKVVNYSDRRKYTNQSNFCYIDFANQRLVFTRQPISADAYSFDYIYIPADLTLSTSPVFPVCHEIIAHGMAIDSYIIQQFDKARSYAPENQMKYESALEYLDSYNSDLISL